MGLDLVLRQTYHLTWLEPDAVQPETARVDAKVAPARVMRAQVEELARCMSVAVEVDTEGSLLSVGQGSRKTAGAVQEIVQASGELGVVGELGSDLRAHVSAGRHEPSRLGALLASRLGALLAWTLLAGVGSPKKLLTVVVRRLVAALRRWPAAPSTLRPSVIQQA
jgi:hypothetical protein